MLPIPDRRPFVLGLCGEIDSGKSHVAKVAFTACLKEGHPCVVLAFATPIKLMLEALLRTHMTRREASYYMTDKDARNIPLDILQGRSVRQAMQTLGTEWGRNMIGPNLWIDIQMIHARVYLAQGVSVIFDDVRFPSEVAAIRDEGGRVVRIYNPLNPASYDPHISERLPPYDEVYENPWAVSSGKP